MHIYYLQMQMACPMHINVPAVPCSCCSHQLRLDSDGIYSAHEYTCFAFAAVDANQSCVDSVVRPVHMNVLCFAFAFANAHQSSLYADGTFNLHDNC